MIFIVRNGNIWGTMIPYPRRGLWEAENEHGSIVSTLERIMYYEGKVPGTEFIYRD